MDLQSLACWNSGFESRLRHGCLSVRVVVRRQLEVSVTGWSSVQGRRTDCVCVSEWDRGTSTVRTSRSNRGCQAMKKNI